MLHIFISSFFAYYSGAFLRPVDANIYGRRDKDLHYIYGTFFLLQVQIMDGLRRMPFPPAIYSLSFFVISFPL